MHSDSQALAELALASQFIRPGNSASVDGRALNQAFMVVCYDQGGRIRSANLQFLRQFGCTLDDIAGQDNSRFLSKSTQRERLASQWSRLSEGIAHCEIGLWVAAGGREIWLESRFIPVADAGGRVEAVVQIAEDVTLRLSRGSEESSQVAAIQATHAVAHFTLDGHVLWVNQRFLDATGFERSEVIDASHSLFLQPEDAQVGPYEEFWQRLGSGQAFNGEVRRRRKDGSELWLQAVYTPILDPAGRPTKVIKYASDITAVKVRQIDFEWQLKAIHKSNCVAAFDLGGALLDANDLFLEQMGYALGEVAGQHHRIFVEHSHVHSTEYAGFWHDLRQGRHRSGLFKFFAQNGQARWLQATYNPIFGATGEPIKVVMFATAVTEDRLLQAEHHGQIAAINNAQCVITFDLDGTIADAKEGLQNPVHNPRHGWIGS